MAEVKEKKATAPKATAKPAAKKETAPKKEAAKPAAKPAVKPAVAKTAPKAEAKVVAKPTAKTEVKAAVKKEVAPKKDKPKGKAPYETNGEMYVEMVHGLSGCTKRQLATVKALGLKKIGDRKLHKDNGAIRGMVTQVAHIVRVEKV